MICVEKCEVINIKDLLHTYNVTVPLRYYTYDLHSKEKDSEYVMGLKQDVNWDVERAVEEPIPDTNQVFKKMSLFISICFVEKIWNMKRYLRIF